MDNHRGICISVWLRPAWRRMLFTSKSARETVEYLRSKADEGTKTVKDSVDNLSETVTVQPTAA